MRYYSATLSKAVFACVVAVSMAQLQLLLDQRNCWQQSIKLELFQGSKDIFRDTVPVHASRKQEFKVEEDAITPVPLYEFELRELLYEATMKSGCKWWCRKSQPSRATQYLTQSLWTIRFVCRHSEKGYQKREKEGVTSRVSRHLLQCGCLASCKFKAISVRMNTTECLFFFALFILMYVARLIHRTEATCHWFFVQHSHPLQTLENFATQYGINALKHGSRSEGWIWRLLWPFSNFEAILKLKPCLAQHYPK
jgi:hypothetical protein